MGISFFNFLFSFFFIYFQKMETDYHTSVPSSWFVLWLIITSSLSPLAQVLVSLLASCYPQAFAWFYSTAQNKTHLVILSNNLIQGRLKMWRVEVLWYRCWISQLSPACATSIDEGYVLFCVVTQNFTNGLLGISALEKGRGTELVHTGWRVILEWKWRITADSDGEFIFVSLQ